MRALELFAIMAIEEACVAFLQEHNLCREVTVFRFVSNAAPPQHKSSAEEIFSIEPFANTLRYDVLREAAKHFSPLERPTHSSFTPI